MLASEQGLTDGAVRVVDVMVKCEGTVRLVRLTAVEEIDALLRLLGDFEVRQQIAMQAATSPEHSNSEVALDPRPST